ncbi:g3271 [Coccomyxa elongata]
MQLKPTCGIPDYKSPADYGLPKNLGATGGSAAGTGGLGSQTSPSGSGGSPSSYKSPAPYSAPADYSAPTAAIASIGGGNGGGSGSGGNGGRSGGGGGGGGGGGKWGSGGHGPWRLLTVLFAALVAAGGALAYSRKGSQASVVASGSITGALLLSAALMGGPLRVPATLLALAASCTLGTYMGKGYVRTKKVFPQGVFAVLSLLLSGGYIISIT